MLEERNERESYLNIISNKCYIEERGGKIKHFYIKITLREVKVLS